MLVERISQFLSYDPESGDFTWHRSPGGQVVPGAKAGSRKGATGYWRIRFAGTEYLAHRLAWGLMTGAMPAPEVMIDHIDCDRANNRWSNLREAVRGENAANCRVRRDGLKGVTRLPSGRYQAQVKKDGKNTYLGSFETEREAHAVYLAAAVELFGAFARAA